MYISSTSATVPGRRFSKALPNAKLINVVCKLTDILCDQLQMTKVLLILSLLISARSIGQTKNYSEKDVYRLFKKSISQRDKKRISIPSNPWIFCNKDSAFYLDDTLRLVSNSYYNHQLFNCCDYVGWTFYQKDKFILTKLQLCKEPTTASATKDQDHFSLKVHSVDNHLTLSIFNSERLRQDYKIVDIGSFKHKDSDETSTVLTLLRVK